MDGKDLVSRADSLMRRRSFVAAPTPAADAPPPAALDVDGDVPVLTDEVQPEMPAAAAPRDRVDETLAARLASEFSHALERRLAAELPGLVEAGLAALEADLRRGIVAAADDAVRDFLARRQQLPLPLDEPDPGHAP